MARRTSALVALCLIFAALLAPSAALASGNSQSAALESSVLRALNTIRLEHGLLALTMSPALSEAAAEHSREMIAGGYFGHSSRDGLAFWQRIARYYARPLSGSWSVGENLLRSPGPIDGPASVAEWMASPLHRANVLSSLWRQIGIGAASSQDAPGVYRGHPVVVITADFGMRQ